MGRKKKITPKSQTTLTNDQIDPYVGEKPFIKNEVNRAEQISRKDDNSITDLSISLEDIDNAIKYYFDNIIKPTVQQNNQQIEVPIMYGSPERWSTVQKTGFIRDKIGKILVPLIVYKRTNIEKNRNLGNKLDGNKSQLLQPFTNRYTRKNQYDRFNLINNRFPQEEFYLTVVPDYVTINYECVIWTNYVQQMNNIVEAINFASDSYWGDPNRFKFRARIDNFSTINELIRGEDRAVKTNFNITMSGYIIPDSINKYKAQDLKKYFSRCTLIFIAEAETTSR